MTKLTVVQAGQSPRQFKLKPGRLSIGSGADAKLSLPGSELAELHADLEIGKDSAVLRMRKGVQSAEVEGRPVTGEWTLAHGQPVEMGDVTLTIEYEGGGSASLVERRNYTTKGQAARQRKAAAGSSAKAAGRTGGAKSGAAAGSSRVQRNRRPSSQGASLPSWAILALVAIALFAGYRIFGGYADSVGDAGFDPASSVAKIELFLKESDIKSAEAELAKVAARDDVPESFQPRFKELQLTVTERVEAAELRVVNNRGTQYLDGQIKGYVSKYVEKDKSSATVRVLLKRMAYFRKEWPKHPDLAYLDRLEDRFGSLANLEDPLTLADLQWEVKTLTWSMPRDYVQAYQLVEDFIANNEGFDADEASKLQGELATAELEYVEDRLQQAKYLWDKEDGESKAKSVEWLVQIIAKVRDAESIDRASTVLLAMPDLESRLRGYRESRPYIWKALKENERVGKRIRTLGL